MSKKSLSKSAARPAGLRTLHVKVASPFKTYFDDEAISISGQNASGSFDVLPGHHNFLSLLKTCDLKLQTERGPQTIRILGGIMHVRADKVVVFLNI